MIHKNNKALGKKEERKRQRQLALGILLLIAATLTSSHVRVSGKRKFVNKVRTHTNTL